ncbi:hypothetical protein [Chitinophaga arvensicola]|uniref:Uncharacterized protein n=1 Tax=Chitinophaga arvensicola TaxID=29529 RepID=A0A1I0S9V0_9BACT|nr:hypothetical protein [Chitinophaga arvensicola]SEW51891.1 hypothetical protein SAMN04488122_4568 [Chitinophaga arvensicola]
MKKYLLLALPMLACSSQKSYTYTRGADGLLYQQQRDDDGFTIPWKTKKKRAAVQPTILFVESVKDFRRSFHHFPQDMWSLQNMNDRSRNAFQDMKSLGFTDLYLDYVLVDSFVVGYTHKPVYEQRIGRTTLPGRDVTGKFIFTYNRQDSSFSYIRKQDK